MHGPELEIKRQQKCEGKTQHTFQSDCESHRDVGGVLYTLKVKLSSAHNVF